MKSTSDSRAATGRSYPLTQCSESLEESTSAQTVNIPGWAHVTPGGDMGGQFQESV